MIQQVPCLVILLIPVRKQEQVFIEKLCCLSEFNFSSCVLLEPRHCFCSCVRKGQAGGTAFPLLMVTTMLQAYLTSQKEGVLES